MEINMKS